MDIPHLVVQVIVAIVCAGIANVLVPRRIPGKLTGLILIGLVGVWLGEWGLAQLQRAYGFNYPFLTWDIEGVEIVPAIIGSAIVLYLVTAFMKWGRYQR
ncbi:MAG: hypothetical protein VKK04_19255 [Synechococcales bacterium]|nr:hypothetical protein [Synechococcales bacterium]